MARETVVSIIKDILSKTLNVYYNDINNDDDIRETLKATEMDFICIMNEINWIFGNYLSEREINKIKTVKDLLDVTFNKAHIENKSITKLRIIKVISNVLEIPISKIPEEECLKDIPGGTEKQKEIIHKLEEEFEIILMGEVDTIETGLLQLFDLQDFRCHSVNQIVDFLHPYIIL